MGGVRPLFSVWFSTDGEEPAYLRARLGWVGLADVVET